MAEFPTENKYARKPLSAVVLSLILPGLGHVYCGRIVKGIILAFLSSIFIPVIFGTLSVSRSSVRMAVVVTCLFASLLVWLIAIVDSWYTAKRTTPAYVLKDYNRWYVYIILILMSTGSSTQIAFNVRSTLLEAFRVPSHSMYPTITYNDRFLANKIAYNTNDPKKGDVVVFISSENRRANWVKRVVAVAGDTVEIKDDQLYINGVKLERESLGPSAFDGPEGTVRGELFIEKNGRAQYQIFLADIDDEQAQVLSDFPKTAVSDHHCFVLGDNRNFTKDSRHYGPVPLATIKGRADYIYSPLKNFSRLCPAKD